MLHLAIDEMLEYLSGPTSDRAFIDVRSELEFSRASIPGSVNLPILFQQERHAVGLAYKASGQAVAMAVGESLVAPHRADRIAAWGSAMDRSASHEGIIMCWRGGLRSQIASEWLAESGRQVYRVAGGYKALRSSFLLRLEQPGPLVVLTGLTGSGKTELLQKLGRGTIDLEGAASHRGSSFGSIGMSPQPSQASFENDIGLQILRAEALPSVLVVEDESRMIGQLAIPEKFFTAMRSAPLVVIEESVERRSARLFVDYIERPLQRGQSLQSLRDQCLLALSHLKRRLDRWGPEIEAQMIAAFQAGSGQHLHQLWIGSLLRHYYDRRYQHAWQSVTRPRLFQGDFEACYAWFQSKWPARAQH